MSDVTATLETKNEFEFIKERDEKIQASREKTLELFKQAEKLNIVDLYTDAFGNEYIKNYKLTKD